MDLPIGRPDHAGDRAPSSPATTALSEFDWLARATAATYSRYLGRGLRDDLLQECRLALCRAADRFDPRHGVPFDKYARLVLQRAAVRLLRAEMRAGIAGLNLADTARVSIRSFQDLEFTDGEELPFVADESAEAQLREVDARDYLRRHLSPTQRRLVELRVEGGYTSAEIAQEEGMSLSRVTMLWNQLVVTLRRKSGDRATRPCLPPAG